MEVEDVIKIELKYKSNVQAKEVALRLMGKITAPLAQEGFFIFDHSCKETFLQEIATGVKLHEETTEVIQVWKRIKDIP